MMKYNLKENIIHGTDKYPFAIYKVDFGECNQQILPCHWHDELEIIYINRGNATFRINDVNHEVHQGQALVINSGELHWAYTQNQSGCSYFAIVFNTCFLELPSRDISQRNYINPLCFNEYNLNSLIDGESTPSKELLGIVEKIIDKNNSMSAGYELATKAYLLLFLSLHIENKLLTPVTLSTVTKKNTQRIKNVLSYIDMNYTQKITVEDLAQVINVSKYHFCRLFKTYTGLSPIEYINMIRINKAEELLRTSDCTITETAFEVGFENLSYFTRQFKRHKGILPSKISL